MLNKTTQSQKDKQYSSDILLETEDRMVVARPLRADIAYGYSFSVSGLKTTGKPLSSKRTFTVLKWILRRALDSRVYVIYIKLWHHEIKSQV